MAIEQMLEEGLDPAVLGLTPKPASQVSEDAETMLPLLRALRRAVGAVRHRQLSKLAMAAAAMQALASSLAGKAAPPPEATAASEGEAPSKAPSEADAPETKAALSRSDSGGSSSSTGSNDAGSLYLDDALNSVAAPVGPQRFMIPKRHPTVSLDSLDELSHGEWAEAEDHALDMAAFYCLGATWCNLQHNAKALRRHGPEVLAYGVLLAVHGGVNDGHRPELGSPKSAKSPTPKTPKSPGSSGIPGAKGGRTDKPVLVRSMAAHLTCFLVASDPALRGALAKHSQSAASLLAYEQLTPTEAVRTAALPGLARLMWSADEEVAFCGASILAAVVAAEPDRSQVSAKAADQALTPALAYALRAVALDRLGPRGNLSNGELQRVLRGPGSASAVSALDHALVAVWGLFNVLLAARDPPAAAAHAHAAAPAVPAAGPCNPAESILAARLAPSKARLSLNAPEGLPSDLFFSRVSRAASHQFRPKKQMDEPAPAPIAAPATEGSDEGTGTAQGAAEESAGAEQKAGADAGRAGANVLRAASAPALKGMLKPKSLMKKVAVGASAPQLMARTSKEGGGAAAAAAAAAANLSSMSGVLEVVLLLCTWNQEGATDENDATAPLAKAATEHGDDSDDDGSTTASASDFEDGLGPRAPPGSGGGGYGALSEAEVRCSVAALAQCAAADCACVAAGLGAGGLSRLMKLAEDGPEAGRSEKVQEAAMDCINALSAAAGDAFEAPAMAGDKRVVAAREALGRFISDEAAVERLAAIRTAVVRRARAHAAEAAATSDPRQLAKIKEGRARCWDVAKSASVATTNFASLAGKGGGQWGGKGQGGGSDVGAAAADDDEAGNGRGLAALLGKKKGLGFGALVVQARAKVMFARKRIVCVAQQLWSENRSVVGQACASLWLLGRDANSRKELAKLCMDSAQGKISGLGGPVVEKLVEGARGGGGGDPVLRGWALSALCALLCDEEVRDFAAEIIQPCLVDTLNEFAKVGDRAERRRRRLEKEQASSGSASVSTGPSLFGGGSSLGGSSLDGATRASAGLLLEAEDDLGRQRLAALAVCGLLTLCYSHAPSLLALRIGVSASAVADPVLSPDEHSVEAALLKIMMRRSSCRRLKRRAGQLLLLVCAEDMDRLLSGEKNKSPSFSAAQQLVAARRPSVPKANRFLPGIATVPLPDEVPDASLAQPSLPLTRLERAANGSSPEGLALEATFLHLLHEQMGPEDEEWANPKGPEDRKALAAEQGLGGRADGPSWWGATKSEPQSPAFGAAMAASSEDVTAVKDPSGAQAAAFGFSGGGDGNDDRERDCLRYLCLHALTDLAARRDRAKNFVVRHGGARLASRIMREPRPPDLTEEEEEEEEDENCDNDDEEEGVKKEEAKEDPELPQGWKRTLPLHFLVNCSSSEEAQIT